MRRSRFLVQCLLPATLALGACADSSDDSPDADETDTRDIAPIDGTSGVDAGDATDAEPDVTPDADATVDAEPDADVAPDVEPDVAPDADPDVAPDADPDVAPDADPDVALDADPDVAPDADPDVAPDADPDTAPDVVQPDTTVDWCRLQFPAEVALTPGDEELFFVRIFEEGVTDASAGNDPLETLSVELGWGADGSDPAAGAWTWQSAEPNTAWTDTEEPGNDEYLSTFVASDAGEFDAAFRVSLDGGATYLYCDTAQGVGADGAENGYQPEAASQVTVSTPDVCFPNPCTTPPANSCTDSGTLAEYDPTGTCSNIEGAAVCDYVPVVTTCETGASCVDGACVTPPEFSFCRLQFPLSLTAEPGTENPYYVRFYGEGLTDGSEENDVIDAAAMQVGVQAGEPALPVTEDMTWMWFDGEANTMWNGGLSGEPTNDEWQAPVTLIDEGTYRVIARVRASASSPWLYCDGGDAGSTDGVSLDFLGVLSIAEESADVCDPNPCNTPPATTCASDLAVRTFEPVGACSEGVDGPECAYEQTDTPCDEGGLCIAGECVFDEPDVFSFCRLQFPLDATAAVSEETEYYVRFYGEGLTDLSDGNDVLPNAIVQVGALPGDAADPTADPDAWDWITGFPNETWDGAEFGEFDNDEWLVPLVQDIAGTYATAARVSADNGETWLYCDGGDAGSTDGIQLENLGELIVSELVIDECDPNPCTTPPAASCIDEFTASQPSALGVCEPTGGTPSCTYEATTVPCVTGERCDAGECVVESPGCDDPFFCSIAEPFCNDAVSFVPTGVGNCTSEGTSASCEFEYIEEDCLESDRSCVGGVCVSNSPVDVSFCRLQFPTMALAGQGGSVTFYTRLFAAGLTDVTPTTDIYSELRVQSGTSPIPVDPAVAPLEWDWVEAVANEDYDGTSSGEPNNDEYQADISLDLFGEYYTVSRVSGDGGATWTYCYAGDAGSTAPFGDGSLGTFNVIPPG